MAEHLKFQPGNLEQEFRTGNDANGLTLVEWIEDRYFAQFGTYSPVDETATAAAQAESDAAQSLLCDPDEIMDDVLRERGIVPGSDDEPGDWYEEVGRKIEQSERNTPVSRGEIKSEDLQLLRRQEDFRKAARALTAHLAGFPEVRKVVLFGSTALPLWKEVPRFSRFRHRRIKLYHECANIDLAVWMTDPAIAPAIRKCCGRVPNELVEQGVHLSLASHHYSVHLVDDASGRYLGMVCHYSQCPKQKPECRVPGCGEPKFVRILPWFKLKPARLNTHNSQILFQRK